MKVRRNNFIWLFAFADLAFLLLISFSQIPNTRLQEIPLPKVPRKDSQELSARAATQMKLLVFEMETDEETAASGKKRSKPFQLVAYQGTEKVDESPRMKDSELLAALRARFAPGRTGPVVWPHPSARAEDLLTAYVRIQQVWPDEEVVIAVTTGEGDAGQAP